MKSIPHALPFAMLCALLGATALTPAALAQTTGAGPSTTEVSPSTSPRGQDQDRRDWRGARDDDERYGSARDSANRSYAEEEDDVDQDGASRRRNSGMSSGMSGMMDPDMMRMHMRMMRAHHRGDGGAGARLHLKRGDAEITIRCPARENIAACVDAVGKLMDRVQSMGTGTTTPSRP